MKNCLFIVVLVISNLVYSCSTCDERPDTHSYINDFDKNVLHFDKDQEIIYLKNNVEKVNFNVKQTLNQLYNLRASDDEVCYADYCETEFNEINIPTTDYSINFSISNQLGRFMHYVAISNSNNYDDYVSYQFLNTGNNSSLEKYTQEQSFFENYLQDVSINNKKYTNVLVYKATNDSENYLIIKPAVGILYFDFNEDNYELLQ